MSRDAWRAGAATLRAAGIETADRDAQILLREVADFKAAIARRATSEPVSHIIGKRAFWKHEFKVTAAVLDPRPDTETLVEQALAVPFSRVLDLGTGSGCILLSLLSERPAATGLGTDISPDALNVARDNAARTGTTHQAEFQIANWFADVSGTFDLIVSNPPYIDAAAYRSLDKGVREFEPEQALTPGGDGLQPYRIIAKDAPSHLREGGAVMVEIGFDQGESVPAIFTALGWSCRLIRDLNDAPRVIVARL